MILDRVTIGVDPDVSKYGFSLFVGDKLISLENPDIVGLRELVHRAAERGPDNVLVVIEDVMSNSFVYKRQWAKIQNLKSLRTMDAKISAYAKLCQDVGRNKHSQEIAEKFIEAAGLTLLKIPPQKGNWADPSCRGTFEAVTGWRGKSNPETRSAAYFGFLGLAKSVKNVRKMNGLD